MSSPKPTTSEIQRNMLEHHKEKRALAPATSSSMNAKASIKRPFSSLSNLPTDSDNEPTDSDDEGGMIEIDQNCDQVRRKIRTFLEAGGMKVTHFQREIGVTASSYGGFMKQNGKYNGANSSTYIAAHQFFKKREEAGIKIPRKTAANKKQKTGRERIGAKAQAGDEVASIHLEGEETKDVRIYDTCDEVRRKINAHLRKPDVVQAAFLRSLAAQYPEPKSITAKQLTDFRSKKGPKAGNNSCVFYTAYVYFEKLRIKEGKKKSKAREEMEELWGAEGIDLTPDNRGYLCGPNERPFVDKYGRVTLETCG